MDKNGWQAHIFLCNCDEELFRVCVVALEHLYSAGGTDSALWASTTAITTLATTYHDMRVPLILSLTNSHNNLLNRYDGSSFTEEEFEYTKGWSLVKGGLTQPITSLVAPLQSERLSRDTWAPLSRSLLFRGEHFRSGEDTGCRGGRRLRASRLALPWAKDALLSDSWAKRRHESRWGRRGGRQEVYLYIGLELSLSSHLSITFNISHSVFTSLN